MTIYDCKESEIAPINYFIPQIFSYRNKSISNENFIFYKDTNCVDCYFGERLISRIYNNNPYHKDNFNRRYHDKFRLNKHIVNEDEKNPFSFVVEYDENLVAIALIYGDGRKEIITQDNALMLLSYK